MKILVSPGFSAGWSTWNSFSGNKDAARFLLTCPYIIEAVEKGEPLDENHPLCKRLEKEIEDRWGEKHVCTLGAEALIVRDVSGKFRVDEYDGSESLETIGGVDWLEAE